MIDSVFYPTRIANKTRFLFDTNRTTADLITFRRYAHCTYPTRPKLPA